MNKKIPFISSIILALINISCSTDVRDEIFQQNKKELVSVEFKTGGDFKFSEHPLKASETEPLDLFALQIYNASSKPYAYVVGNDISLIKVDFIKDLDYKLKMTYLKNGKEIIYKTPEENKWGAPFTTYGSNTQLNKVYYSSATELTEISSAYIHSIHDSLSVGRYVEIDRYHGIVDISSVLDSTEVLIPLKRMVFGVNLNVELKETDVDQIRFSINYRTQHQQEYFVPLTEGRGNLYIPFLSLGFPGHYFSNEPHLDYGTVENYNEPVHISLGTAENYIRFYDGAVDINRNVMVTMNFQQQQATDNSESNVTLTLEEGELEEIEVSLK